MGVGETFVPAAQGSRGCLSPGAVQGPVAWGPGAPIWWEAFLPAARDWTMWPLRSLPTWITLWFTIAYSRRIYSVLFLCKTFLQFFFQVLSVNLMFLCYLFIYILITGWINPQLLIYNFLVILAFIPSYIRKEGLISYVSYFSNTIRTSLFASIF